MANIVLRRNIDLVDSIMVTGFRGFGMVGYMVSKHLAMSLNAEKIGYILTDETPPIILVEEDGVGFPFEIYYSRKANTVIIVNRALPERANTDDYAKTIAGWANTNKIRYAILVGGLSRDFMPSGEGYGYRWISNKYYHGPKLDAPLMEAGLGVMGPLALLYIYLDYYRVPSIMVLPYSLVDEIDYNAAVNGVKIILEKLVGVKADLTLLEEMASRQKEEAQKILQLMREQLRREGEEKGMYM